MASYDNRLKILFYIIEYYLKSHQLAHKSFLARDPVLLGMQWPARDSLWQERRRAEQRPCHACFSGWESKGRQPRLTTGRTSKQASLKTHQTILEIEQQLFLMRHSFSKMKAINTF